MRHVAGMREGHHAAVRRAVRQEILETQVAVAAGQCRAARPDDEPADAVGLAIQVHGLHQPEPDERIGAGQHGQPRDLGAGVRDDPARQGDAALDQQAAAPCAGLDAGRADGLARRLVDAQQHRCMEIAVQCLDLREMRHRFVAQMVSVSLGTETTGQRQLGLRPGDSDIERQGRKGGVSHAGSGSAGWRALTIKSETRSQTGITGGFSRE